MIFVYFKFLSWSFLLKGRILCCIMDKVHVFFSCLISFLRVTTVDLTACSNSLANKSTVLCAKFDWREVHSLFVLLHVLIWLLVIIRTSIFFNIIFCIILFIILFITIIAVWLLRILNLLSLNLLLWLFYFFFLIHFFVLRIYLFIWFKNLLRCLSPK